MAKRSAVLPSALTTASTPGEEYSTGLMDWPVRVHSLPASRRHPRGSLRARLGANAARYTFIKLDLPHGPLLATRQSDRTTRFLVFSLIGIEAPRGKRRYRGKVSLPGDALARVSSSFVISA